MRTSFDSYTSVASIFEYLDVITRLLEPCHVPHEPLGYNGPFLHHPDRFGLSDNFYTFIRR